jgi:diguanylate cyclase (GGDEF)-like protein
MEKAKEVSQLKDITVLYCEDEQYLRDVTKGILESFTKQQFIAEDGEAGLNLFLKNQDTIDLIITDVNMPKMNGLEMAREIKAINPNIPIIVATAFSNSEYLLEAIELGVDKYVLKPINIKKLLDTMKQSLLYHELRDLYTDQLTHTANRNALIRDIKDSETQNTTMALIDIDKFSVLNDLYGEANGDRILEGFTKKLKEHFKDEIYKIYRVGSDRFVVFTNDSSISIDDFKSFCELFALNIDQSGITIDETNVDINITIGIAQSDDKHTFEYVQRAIQKARTKYLQILEFDISEFDHKEDFQKNIDWIKKIKNGYINGNFQPYLQPIVDTNTKEVYKYEALIRYIEEDGSQIAPFEFLSIAKKAKLYPYIIKIMLSAVIKIIDKKDVRVAVNLSFDDIINKETYFFIMDTLKAHKKQAKNIDFEILESEEINDYDLVSGFITDVKQFGCTVGIDDFGAGYSNFNILGSLDIDFVKIDGSLIKRIDEEKKQALIVESITNFCNKLGINTVAEFVSTKEIYEATKELGINYMQGYYFGKPVAQTEI